MLVSTALLLALASAPGPTAPSTLFVPRAYQTARGEVPHTFRRDGLAVRTEGREADVFRTLARAAPAKLPGLAEVTLARPGLWVAWLDDDAEAGALRAWADALAAQPAVEAVYPILARGKGWAVVSDHLVVTADPGRLDEVLATLTARGLRLLRRSTVPDTALLAVDRAFSDAVAASAALRVEGLLAAEPELLFPLAPRATVNDPLHNNQWHLDRPFGSQVPGAGQIHVHEAWDVTFGDPAVLLGVVDTGCDIDHEDLAANVVGGFDAINNDDDPRPGCSPSPDGAGPAGTCPQNAPYRDSHGTAVAGAMAARGNNGIGIAGVCPSCSLYSVRFIGGALVTSLSAAEVMVRLVDEGAWVINNSWGLRNGLFVPLSQAERTAFDYAHTEGRDGLGTVVVFAAGNESQTASTDPYASYPSIITVSASTNLDDWAYYSNFGPPIDVAAPSLGGVSSQDSFGIFTTDVSGGEGYDDGDYHAFFGGTSAAAPLVSGLCGLILSANPTLTDEQVRLALTSTAEKITASTINWEAVFGIDLEAAFAYDENGHSWGFGWGRIHAGDAVAAALTPSAQGGLCTPGCAACDDEWGCELGCNGPGDCIDGTLCEDGVCQRPRPGPVDIGQPCTPDCPYCTPTLDSRALLSPLCTDTCEEQADCPEGWACRVIDDDGTRVCAVGSPAVGGRNYFRNCRFGQIVRDSAGRGYCSEMCFGEDPGDCPWGFTCAAANCECVDERQFGCAQWECSRTLLGGNWATDLCFPDVGFGAVCEDDLHCPPGEYCAPEGTCRTDDRQGCTVCQQCGSDDDCAPGELCYTTPSSQLCTHGCETDEDCPGDSVCRNLPNAEGRDRLGCRAPTDEGGAFYCDTTYTCSVACRDDVPCPEGEQCVDGACEPLPDPEPEPEPDSVNPGIGFIGLPACDCRGPGTSSAAPALLGILLLPGLLLRSRRRRSSTPGGRSPAGGSRSPQDVSR